MHTFLVAHSTKAPWPQLHFSCYRLTSAHPLSSSVHPAHTFYTWKKPFVSKGPMLVGCCLLLGLRTVCICLLGAGACLGGHGWGLSVRVVHLCWLSSSIFLNMVLLAVMNSHCAFLWKHLHINDIVVVNPNPSLSFQIQQICVLQVCCQLQPPESSL